MAPNSTRALASERITDIEPPRGLKLPDLKELWRYRDLVYFLARRDVIVRHQQAVAGFIWAVFQPLFLAGLFAVFLGLVAKVDGPPGVPYPLYCLSGLVAWLGFTKTVDNATTSSISFEPLITKVYLPRILIPLTTAAVPVLDMTVGFLVVLAMGLAYGFVPGIEVLLAPATLALGLALALGFGLWLSALNVKYRDFGLLLPNALLAGLFVTPIMYPLSQVPADLQPLYALNPMVGVLELFRWAMLNQPFPEAYVVAVPVLAAPLLLLTGALYFERAQMTFADVI